MSFNGTAAAVRTTSSSVEELLRGRVSSGIAAALKVTSSSVQQFIDGQASPGVAAALGITTSELQGLRNALGGEGAIGFVLGLAAGFGKTKNT